ncbi:MAG: GNAT family N-acetyltransferase [Thermoguttaceae bacterium]|jgi:GNAT superfamily N-acetyltransferase|nr:GNAT family N-acetyltransferase [Thermoguttaceae bacterium]
MKRSYTLSPVQPADHEPVARLLHRSLVDWYEKNLRAGARFGTSHEPFLLFPQVYESLDPGEGIVARGTNGEVLGVCFVHPRETHVSVGIVATDPEAGGSGIARAMMEAAIARANDSGKPVRLVSSLLNLDSFSLYSRLGFVPHTFYQDLSLDVPAAGMTVPAPPGAERVRPARPDEAARLADFEHQLQGIRREPDYAFFFRNDAGSWQTLVLEDAEGALEGFLVGSHHPAFNILGPGVARDEAAATALLWRSLNAQPGRNMVFLLPCAAAGLIRTAYSWGARNVELHAAQILGPTPQASGIVFATYLPESA